MDPKRLDKRKASAKIDHRKVVGSARNEFGTRLCQRVTCQRCKKTDHVSVRVGSDKEKLCRDCAESILGAFDQGRQLLDLRVKRTCTQCHREFLIKEAVSTKKDEIVCLDCYRGFYVWRNKIPVKENVEGGAIRSEIRAGTKTKLRKIQS